MVSGMSAVLRRPNVLRFSREPSFTQRLDGCKRLLGGAFVAQELPHNGIGAERFSHCLNALVPVWRIVAIVHYLIQRLADDVAEITRQTVVPTWGSFE